MKVINHSDCGETVTWDIVSTPGESWYRIKFFDWVGCTGELNDGDRYGVVVEYMSSHYVTMNDLVSAYDSCGGDDCSPETMIDRLFDYGKGGTEQQYWGNNKRSLLQSARAYVRRAVGE